MIVTGVPAVRSTPVTITCSNEKPGLIVTVAGTETFDGSLLVSATVTGSLRGTGVPATLREMISSEEAVRNPRPRLSEVLLNASWGAAYTVTTLDSLATPLKLERTR